MKGGFLLNKNSIKEFMKLPGATPRIKAHWQGRRLFEAEDSDSKTLYDSILDKLFEKDAAGNWKNTVTLLSYKSLYGFVYKIDVPDTLAFFSDFKWNNPDTDKFVPIKSYLVKITIVTGRTEIPYRYRSPAAPVNKHTNTLADFNQEIQVQYDLYNNNFEGGEYLVPPMLASFGVFRDSIGIPEIDAAVLQVRRSYPGAKLGISCMKMLTGFRTLHACINDPALTLENKEDAILLAYTALVMLIERNGIIHRDAHLNNIMVSIDYEGFVTPPNTGKAIVIDFGRIKRDPVLQRELNTSFSSVTFDVYDRVLPAFQHRATQTRPASNHITNLFNTLNDVRTRNGKAPVAIDAFKYGAFIRLAHIYTRIQYQEEAMKQFREYKYRAMLSQIEKIPPRIDPAQSVENFRALFSKIDWAESVLRDTLNNITTVPQIAGRKHTSKNKKRKNKTYKRNRNLRRKI